MDKNPDPLQQLQAASKIKHGDNFKREPIAEMQLDRDLELLRTWQSARLAETYADLLADPRYHPACAFFLSDLYAARDFSQRNYDVQRLHQLLSPILPPRVVRVMENALRLTHLTDQLDHRLVRELVDQLGVTDAIDGAIYAEGYRRCANYDDRVEQIDLLVTVVQEVGALAHMPMVNLGLKLAEPFAQRLGWEEIYDFLRRGYAAFVHIRDIKFFAQAIGTREKQILRQIWDQQPDPFTTTSQQL